MNLADRTILITGSTDGVGRHVALELAAAGARVLIHGRNRERAEAVMGEIRKRGNDTSVFYPADLSSLGEVRDLAAAVRRGHERLDVLVNNAGIGSRSGGAQRRTSAEGYEVRFAVNYLAGVLLTRLLLPLIVASAPARIVNVASAGQRPIDFDDVMLTRGYDGSRAYTQSKLAQIMFTFDLAHELKESGVTVNCLHPATYMDTTMVREGGVSPISTVDEGAAAILNLVLSPDLEGRTGLYFDRQRISRANPQAYDEGARGRLRALTLKLIGLEGHIESPNGQERFPFDRNRKPL
jgi:NAD(P)-dependent dehydrogenase (short-subunit alcohol dehydrogenase family)